VDGDAPVHCSRHVLYDLKLANSDKGWIRKCKTYFMWLKAPLMVRAERRMGYW